MSFASLKKNRANNLNKIVDKLKNEGKGNYKDEDDRFWKPYVDPKTELGSATIRFLPAPDGDDAPWVKMFSHGFQGDSGKWLIEECPTTIGLDCPICAANQPLWDGSNSDKEIARKRKRRVQYVSNIMVVRDPSQPENEGKVFLFKYGKQIHDKIMALANPEFEDEDPVNPFDLWEGANFKLKITKNEGGYRTYEKSTFDNVAPLSDDDDELEAIWNKEYKLSELVEPSKYKSAEELKQRMNAVDNGTGSAASVEDAVSRAVNKRKENKTVEDKPDPVKEAVAASTDDGEDEDWEKLLQGL